MATREVEFFVGDLFYLSVSQLQRCPGVQSCGEGMDEKIRPFLCYAIDSSSRVYLAPLTTKRGAQRLQIQLAWFRRPPDEARRGDVFLFHGRRTFRASAATLGRLLGRDLACQATRPILGDRGLDRVLRAIRRDGGLLPPEERPCKPIW